MNAVKDPVLIDVPFPIETHRLHLRSTQTGDGKVLCEAVRESIAELRPWMVWAQSIPSEEDQEIVARKAHARALLREDFHILGFERATGALALCTGLHRFSFTAGRFEIGYWVRTSFSGRGLVTEAAAALTSFAFGALGAKRVEIRCDAENERSLKVAERLGFDLEGRLKLATHKGDGQTLSDLLVLARFDTKGLPDVGVRWG